MSAKQVPPVMRSASLSAQVRRLPQDDHIGVLPELERAAIIFLELY